MLLGAIWYTHSYEPLELERTRRQCSCGVKHLKDLGAAYEIVRWRREKRRQALFSPQRERVAKSELLSQPQLDHINGSERPRFRLNKPVSSGPQHGSFNFPGWDDLAAEPEYGRSLSGNCCNDGKHVPDDSYNL
jgi:hypothetical protein